MLKTCRHGHPLTLKNRTARGDCLTCRREREGYQGGIRNSAKTTCPHGHPLMGANVAVYKRGEKTYRACRQCAAARGRAYYWNKIKPAYHPRSKPGRPRKYE